MPCTPAQRANAAAQAAAAEAASLRKRLAAEGDLARKQIAELEGKAHAAAAERESLLEKVRTYNNNCNWRDALWPAQLGVVYAL